MSNLLGKKDLIMELLIGDGEIANIRITCRCGHQNQFKVLKPILQVARVVARCQNQDCGQPYGLGSGSIMRLDKETLIPELNHIIQSTKPQVRTMDDEGIRTEREHHDIGDAKVPPVIEGTFATNESKMVN